jgi:hypothetical protein
MASTMYTFLLVTQSPNHVNYSQGAINAVSAPYLTATSGLMGTESYHAGAIRTLLINVATEYVFPYGEQQLRIMKNDV